MMPAKVRRASLKACSPSGADDANSAGSDRRAIGERVKPAAASRLFRP
jgi:hypothetical protein